jgi:hypothetical protein
MRYRLHLRQWTMSSLLFFRYSDSHTWPRIRTPTPLRADINTRSNTFPIISETNVYDVKPDIFRVTLRRRGRGVDHPPTSGCNQLRYFPLQWTHPATAWSISGWHAQTLTVRVSECTAVTQQWTRCDTRLTDLFETRTIMHQSCRTPYLFIYLFVKAVFRWDYLGGVCGGQSGSGRGFSPTISGFPLVSIIPPLHHTHISWRCAICTTDNTLSLSLCLVIWIFPKLGGVWKEALFV